MGSYTIKADPKAWFSAERTCLHWMSASMLLAVTSASFETHLKLGFILTGVSLAVYSFYRYSQRVESLENKSALNDNAFYEILGPLMLSTALTLLLIIAFVSNEESFIT